MASLDKMKVRVTEQVASVTETTYEVNVPEAVFHEAEGESVEDYRDEWAVAGHVTLRQNREILAIERVSPGDDIPGVTSCAMCGEADPTRDCARVDCPNPKPAADPAERLMSVEARRARFDELAEEFPTDLTVELAEERENPKRWLLIEENVGGNTPAHWLTTHAEPQQASDYHAGQEYREDWNPIMLVDLDSGDKYDANVAVVFEGL